MSKKSSNYSLFTKNLLLPKFLIKKLEEVIKKKPTNERPSNYVPNVQLEQFSKTLLSNQNHKRNPLLNVRS